MYSFSQEELDSIVRLITKCPYDTANPVLMEMQRIINAHQQKAAENVVSLKPDNKVEDVTA